MSLEDAVLTAITEAGITDGPEPPEPDDTDPDADSEVEPEAEPEAEPEPEVDEDPAKGEGKAKEPELDELGKKLADLGIKPPKEGERENRLPYKRVKRIVENALKKESEAHAAALKAKEDEYSPFKDKAQQFDSIAQQLKNDPEGFMRRLAMLEPQNFQRFLTVLDAKLEKEEAKVPTVSELGDMPKPDVKLEDGSLGYSPEQWEKREKWIRDAAKVEATTALRAELDKRLKPYEDRDKQLALNERFNKQIAEQHKWAIDTYGEFYNNPQTQNEIAALMKDARSKGQTISFERAVATVVKPKMQADRDKMRSELFKEMNEKRKGARKVAAPSQSKVEPVNTDEARSTDSVVWDAIRKAGLDK